MTISFWTLGWRTLWRDLRSGDLRLLIVVVTLAVAALMAWWLRPDEQMLRAAAIALAAMPMLSIYPVLAQKYRHEGFTAAALMVTTLSSFFTLSALLWLLQHWVVLP